MAQEKKIIIEEIDGVVTMHTINFSFIEQLGALRYFEKDLWLRMQQNKVPTPAKPEKKEPKRNTNIN